MPNGLRGVLFAALFGAVMSSLDSMLNSASTIFTIDIYQRVLRPAAGPRDLVTVGRVSTAVFVLVGCLLAPLLGRFEGVFQYIQLIWGFISPAVVTVFVFGLLVPWASSSAAVVALVLGVPVYGLLLWALPDVAFLNHMAVTAAVLVVAMSVMTLRAPFSEPRQLGRRSEVDLTPDPLSRSLGMVIIALTVTLYVVFW